MKHFLIPFVFLVICLCIIPQIISGGIVSISDFDEVKIITDEKISNTLLPGDVLASSTITDTSTMETFVKNEQLYISDSDHTTREIKLSYEMLIRELPSFDGKRIRYLHLNDMGIIDESKTVYVYPVDGYVTITADFSTVIIGGFTGYTEFSDTNISGNTTISFNEINVSSIDVNFTCYSNDTWDDDFEDWGKRIKLVNDSVIPDALTDYQVLVNITYDDDMQVDFDDLRPVQNGKNLSYWIVPDKTVNSEYANVWVNLSTVSNIDGVDIFIYYGNPTTETTSSNVDTFPFYDDFDDNNYDGWSVQSGTWSAVSGYLTKTDAGGWYGISIPFSMDSAIWEFDLKHGGDTFMFFFMDENGDVFTMDGYAIKLTGVEASSSLYEKPDGIDHFFFTRGGDWNNIKVTRNTTGFMEVFIDDVSKGSVTDVSVLDSAYLSLWGYDGGGAIDNIIVRKYTPTEPNLIISGNEQQYLQSNKTNIAVTGDFNIFTSQPSEKTNFTLIPTENISEINFISNLTDYGYTVTVFWSNNTSKVSETFIDGYANLSISFTPLENITAGFINATYEDTNFANCETVGALNVTQDDVNVSINATRNGQNVSLSVVNLVASQEYIFNFSTFCTLREEDINDPVISNTQPANDSIFYQSQTPNFNCSSNQTSNNAWILNGSIVEWDNSTTSPDYHYIDGVIGNHNLTIVVYNATNSSFFTSYEWNFSVIPDINYYNLSGYVTDNSSLPVNVCLVSNNTYSDYTNEFGYYFISNIPNGSYYFTYYKTLYETNTSLIVINGSDVNLNVTLIPISYTNELIYDKIVEVDEKIDNLFIFIIMSMVIIIGVIIKKRKD